jgi:hypothetical protein
VRKRGAKAEGGGGGGGKGWGVDNRTAEKRKKREWGSSAASAEQTSGIGARGERGAAAAHLLATNSAPARNPAAPLMTATLPASRLTCREEQGGAGRSREEQGGARGVKGARERGSEINLCGKAV